MGVSGGTFKHIEGELYHYHETKKELEQLRQEILHQAIRPANGMNIPDPTGEKATSLVYDARIRHMEKILNAISDVHDTLPEEKRRLISLLYWEKPRQYTWEGIATKLHVSKRQAQRWRRSIVEEIANRLGWR